MARDTGSPLIGHKVRHSEVVARATAYSIYSAHARKIALLEKIRRAEASRRPVKWYVRFWRWLIKRA